MAHRNVFPDDCEIVEIEEEDLNPREHYIGFGQSKAEMRTESNVERLSSLEDDLNQLFEIFNRKASTHGLGNQDQSDRSPSWKNASKKPVRLSGSHSPKYGISERVNLKQALRGLCISQASEMAALKRAGKSGTSSEAGKIMTMYRNAVVEDTGSVISQDEGKNSLLEISLVPEEITVESFHKIPERQLASDFRSSSPNGLASKGIGSAAPQNRRIVESKEIAKDSLKPELLPKGPPSSQYRFSRDAAEVKTGQAGPANVMQSSVKFSWSEAGNRTPFTEMPKRDRHSSLPASPAAKLSTVARNSLIENDLFSAPPEPGTRTSLPELPLRQQRGPMSPLHSSDDNHGLLLGKDMMQQKEVIQTQSGAGHRSSKAVALRLEEWPAVPLRSSDVGNNSQDANRGSRVSSKAVKSESKAKSPASKDKVSAVKGQIDSSQKVPPSSPEKANKASKPAKNSSRFGKPGIKSRSFLRRKSKKDLAKVESLKKSETDPNDNTVPGANQVVCPNCHCLLPDALREVKQDSLLSPAVDLSIEASSGHTVSDTGASELITDGISKTKAIIEPSSNLKSRDKGEFTQSSKSSPGECSSSTSISEESNISRPSCCDRPHMSKDLRWEAIRHVRLQQGTLGLRHFNLLKKLGCGDIGTVYLAELIGTNSLFAIKVMDNEFLARRKKITRAQTEREILRMLDHPFLPTLYCQFTSDNLSCLVMEYCPGGDLHVLRQKQPGRCYSELAARFYVAEVLLALEYLHMLGVVYRDLKPENILVREDGHIMLSDFDLSLRCAVNPTLLVSSSVIETTKRMSGPCVDSGCAEPFCIGPSCRVSCFTPRRLPGSSSKSRNKLKSEAADQLRPLLVAEPISARSNSFVGTHEYLAPEIIKGEGHGSSVDWWTFGIFLYELFYGRTPFKGAGNEETLANVVLQSLKFPDSPLVSLQARDLIVSLLVKEPENRLGSERGAADIKQHPFFEGLNWALIRCAVPPELPEPCNFGFQKPVSPQDTNKYLDYNGEQLEFEVF